MIFMAEKQKINKGADCGTSDLLLAAVILDHNSPIEGLNNSKKLTEKKREALYPEIIAKDLDYCIVHISPQEVDKINILEARKLGMAKAIAGLKRQTMPYLVVILFHQIFVPPQG